MSEIIDVQFGQSLPPERWHLAGERLAPIFRDMMDGAEELPLEVQATLIQFKEDLQLALVALGYVARFASDNCRFVSAEGIIQRPDD